MTGSQMYGLWLKARVTVYIAVVALILLLRVGVPWRQLQPPTPQAPPAGSALLISGRDLAPALIDELASNYRRDYPDLEVRVSGGGTNRALEDLANRRADVAFLSRPPAPAEQQVFAAANGDTALWFPLALGALVLVRGAAFPSPTLTPAACREFLASSPGAAAAEAAPRFYAADPNVGVWDAFLAQLGLAGAPATRPGAATFLKDEAAVFEAVAADPGSLGLVSSFNLPEAYDRGGPGLVAVPASDSSAPAAPTFEAVAYGEYPLIHYLYVACRPANSIRGAMFVTHVTSDRGQRQVERAGFLPARHTMRPITLTTHSLGKSD